MYPLQITYRQLKEPVRLPLQNMMEKTDKSRAAYYNYYTNKTWGMASSYNFSIDVSVLGIDETVEFMKSFIERRLNKRPPHFG